MYRAKEAGKLLISLWKATGSYLDRVTMMLECLGFPEFLKANFNVACSLG
jgi:hypothetical protein